MAETTLGSAMAAELEQSTPVNLLLPADLLDRLATEHPDSLQAVRAALERGTSALVGGGHEGPLPLWPLETVLADLQVSGEQYQQLLGRRPQVFGRRRYGLSPVLPLVLSRFGYRGALHFTLEDGRFPLGESKVRWEAGRESIDALARLPRDAACSETFLEFAKRMGEAMDADHWPRSCLPIGPAERALGMPICGGRAVGPMRLADLSRWTNTSAIPTRPTTPRWFVPDEYRSPYLKQTVGRQESDPLSSSVGVQRRQAAAAAEQTLGTLAALVVGSTANLAEAATSVTSTAPTRGRRRPCAGRGRTGRRRIWRDAAPQSTLANAAGAGRAARGQWQQRRSRWVSRQPNRMPLGRDSLAGVCVCRLEGE